LEIKNIVKKHPPILNIIIIVSFFNIICGSPYYDIDYSFEFKNIMLEINLLRISNHFYCSALYVLLYKDLPALLSGFANTHGEIKNNFVNIGFYLNLSN
jgi:hypothetical protein